MIAKTSCPVTQQRRPTTHRRHEERTAEGCLTVRGDGATLGLVQTEPAEPEFQSQPAEPGSGPDGASEEPTVRSVVLVRIDAITAA